MKTIEEIGIHDLKEHIIRNWMTHDGMWFYHCLGSHGIEEANRINKAAIKSLAAIELKRAIQLFGISGTDTFERIKDVVDAAFCVSKGDFMSFDYTFPEKDLLRWEWKDDTCFAYQGMKRMGAIDRYECGVIFRVLCWLDNLGVGYSVEPDLSCCLMHSTGRCEGRIRLILPSKRG
ncbi:MAG: hypothetical protein EG824_14185 [Deltaproteobacteria bacterium]|nr:hypothetical protein [Deltaproteobacteria bacterium]